MKTFYLVAWVVTQYLGLGEVTYTSHSKYFKNEGVANEYCKIVKEIGVHAVVLEASSDDINFAPRDTSYVIPIRYKIIKQPHGNIYSISNTTVRQ